MADNGARRRIVGGGRRPLLGAVEDALVDLIYEKRIRKEKVSRSWIALTALELFHQSRTEEEHEEDPIRFVASDPWINNFMSRNNLSLRKRTNLTTLTDDVLVERAVAHMQFLEEHKPQMNRERTILMDETAVYFEDARAYTVADVGARHVVLPPCLIWKRKNRGSIKRLGGCYIAYQPRAWVDQDMLLNWLDWYYPIVLQTTGQYVVWDSMRAHIGKRVKQRCSEKSIKMAVVPGGLTPYLQAGDVGIYKSFKDNISQLIDDWKCSDKVTYTKGGALVSSWVAQAWKQTPVEVVEKSVQACGFNDDSSAWHISKHDVYGSKFRTAWQLRESEDRDSDHEDNIAALMETLDEILIED